MRIILTQQLKQQSKIDLKSPLSVLYNHKLTGFEAIISQNHFGFVEEKATMKLTVG